MKGQPSRSALGTDSAVRERLGLRPESDRTAGVCEAVRHRTEAEPLGAAPRIGHLAADLTRAFSPLGRELDVHVSPLPGDYVRLSVALPHGMARSFAVLLESLAGLVRFVDHRERIALAEVRAVDPVEVLERRQAQEDYRAAVCSLFDRFTAAGWDRKEAVRRTSRALKEESHPWSTVDLVEGVLRECGRFRRGRRSR